MASSTSAANMPNLQYRINGIMIPEPISGFGQSFDTRIINQVNLMTGALPAQYGLQTAGIIDIRTNEGDTGNGGAIDVYGGSHQTIEQRRSVWLERSIQLLLHRHARVKRLGNRGAYLGPESAARSNHSRRLVRLPVVHDQSAHARELDVRHGRQSVRTAEYAGTYPHLPAQWRFRLSIQPDLNETQSELNKFAVVALQGTNGAALDYQVSLFTRYTRTQFNPDPIGDLISTALRRTTSIATMPRRADRYDVPDQRRAHAARRDVGHTTACRV